MVEGSDPSLCQLCVHSRPSHLQEAPSTTCYEDVCVAGWLGPPFLVGGGRECQQRVAIYSEQDRVDQGYTGNGEAHSLEEAQDLQSNMVAP